MTAILLYIGLGALGAALWAAAGLRFQGERRTAWYFAAIAGMNGVYAGLALGHGFAPFVVESLIGIGLCTLAVIFWDKARIAFALIIGVHAGIDAIHMAGLQTAPPVWYAVGCLSFDIVLAAAAFTLLPSRLEDHRTVT